jgi:hypothetical protein
MAQGVGLEFKCQYHKKKKKKRKRKKEREREPGGDFVSED